VMVFPSPHVAELPVQCPCPRRVESWNCTLTNSGL
jgi:hypothetical protein